MILIGHQNYINEESIIVILKADSSGAKSLIKSAQERNLFTDATAGRKRKSVLVTKTNQVIISSLTTDTLVNRIHLNKKLYKSLKSRNL